MRRGRFKEILHTMNDIYYSMDWIPEGDISYECFNEENSMPDSLKVRLATLIWNLDEAL